MIVGGNKKLGSAKNYKVALVVVVPFTDTQKIAGEAHGRW
jgi:hypothetical protein